MIALPRGGDGLFFFFKEPQGMGSVPASIAVWFADNVFTSEWWQVNWIRILAGTHKYLVERRSDLKVRSKYLYILICLPTVSFIWTQLCSYFLKKKKQTPYMVKRYKLPYLKQVIARVVIQYDDCAVWNTGK